MKKNNLAIFAVALIVSVAVLTGCNSTKKMHDQIESGNIDSALDIIQREIEKLHKKTTVADAEKGTASIPETTIPEAKVTTVVAPVIEENTQTEKKISETQKPESDTVVEQTKAKPIEGSELEQKQEQKAEIAPAEESWIDNFDLEAFLKNPWLIAGIFLLIQWLEIWYYNRTGKTSKTIDSTEAALNSKLGVIQKIAYRIWRNFYFKTHPNKNDPDKKPENIKEEEK